MDYKAIKEEYETTKTSFKKLAEKYNINYKKIERMAKKQGWVKFNPINPLDRPPSKPTLTKYKPYRKEVKELEEHLNLACRTAIDRVLIESYMCSYRIFKLLEYELDYNDMNNNETIRMQQLQIERNNLNKMSKEISEMFNRLGGRKMY